jgi:hypothetical protein
MAYNEERDCFVNKCFIQYSVRNLGGQACIFVDVFNKQHFSFFRDAHEKYGLIGGIQSLSAAILTSMMDNDYPPGLHPLVRALFRSRKRTARITRTRFFALSSRLCFVF